MSNQTQEASEASAFDSVVQETRALEKYPVEVPEGMLVGMRYQMTDGYAYDRVIGFPASPVTTVPVEMTTEFMATPHSTSFRGRLRWFMGQGFMVDVIGPELIPRQSGRLKHLFTHIPAVFGVELARSAHNNLQIRLNDAPLPGTESLPLPTERTSIDYNYSRAAMIEAARQRLAVSAGHRIVFSKEVDPGYPRSRALLALPSPQNIWNESVAMRHEVNRIRSLEPDAGGSEVDTSLDYMWPAIGTMRTLMSGVAGREARKSPKDADRLVVLHRSSVIADIPGWRHVYRDHARVKIEVKGKTAHTSHWRPDLVDDNYVILGYLGNKLGPDNNPDDVDIEEMHALRAEASVQRKRMSKKAA